MKVTPSERLSYRLLTEADGKLMYELDQDPEVMKFISKGKTNTMDDIETVFIPRLKKYMNPSQGWGIWGVFEHAGHERADSSNLADESFVGWILIRPMDFFGEQPKWDELEIGWRFKRASWGKGYATEAAAQVMTAVKELGIAKSVSAIALPENTASIGVMKKLGLGYDSTYLHKDPLGDVDVVYYRLDW